MVENAIPIATRVAMKILDRVSAFCKRFGLRVPILLAPMAGSCPPSLSIAVANAGGLGACGALMMSPTEIEAWASEVRASTNGGFNINLWIPDPPPVRDAAHEARLRTFLAKWGPEVPEGAGDAALPDFEAQCEALVRTGPAAVSSIMGLFPSGFVSRLRERGVAWFATASTVAEARAAEAAGADVIIAQGAEAGGHRGAFDAGSAERALVGLFALLPAVVDAVRVPVVATGGIADGRGVAAALALGASAAQIGTGFLRTPEAKAQAAWVDALGRTAPEDTMITRAFTGRPARCIANDFARAAATPDAPAPAPYPVQRGLVTPMRNAAHRAGDASRMQLWAGQSAALAKAEPAGQIVQKIWEDARALLALAANS
jgi:nitronate monooxygenase